MSDLPVVSNFPAPYIVTGDYQEPAPSVFEYHTYSLSYRLTEDVCTRPGGDPKPEEVEKKETGPVTAWDEPRIKVNPIPWRVIWTTV